MHSMYSLLHSTEASCVSKMCGRMMLLGFIQVSNSEGSVVSSEAYVRVDAVDIFSRIERHVERNQITFQSLFMQFNRSKASEAPRHQQAAECAAVTTPCSELICDYTCTGHWVSQPTELHCLRLSSTNQGSECNAVEQAVLT